MRYHPLVKEKALIRYKREKTAALDWYNTNVVATWDAFGRPTSSVECKRALDAVWVQYVAALRAIGARYDDGLLLAEFMANETAETISASLGLSATELSHMGLV